MAKTTSHIATNAKARHDFFIEQDYEAGIVLQGCEVKAIRTGKLNLTGAFARIENGEALLYGCHIGPYDKAPNKDYNPIRPRKLLLNRKEIRKLAEATTIAHRALVVLDARWHNGNVKITIAVATGKNQGDKRQSLKKADAKREIERSLKS